MGVIPGATNFNKLTDKQVRDFLEALSKESVTNVSLAQLDSLVNQKLRMYV